MNERPSSQRLDNLESALAHQQHAFDSLNEVVIGQAKTIEVLERRLQKLEAKLDDLQSQLPGDRVDPEAERPPHY